MARILKTKSEGRNAMRCRKRGRAIFCGHLLGVLSLIGLIIFITKTKKGRKISKKARRIAGEVEDIVKDELGM